MTAANLHNLITRFRELEREGAALEQKRRVWANDVHKAVNNSDENMLAWLKTTLELSDAAATLWVHRAIAYKVAPDEATHKALGGTTEIKRVAHLPRKEQVAILEAAKVQKVKIVTVLRERGHLPPLPSTPVAPSVRTQLEELATFIDGCGVRLPNKIKAIVRAHARQQSLSA